MLNPAGFIDGARVHGETLRRALYASTSGATGVTRAGDLAVIPLAVPGPAVTVTAGGGVIATRFTDADPGQSYSVSNSGPLQVDVPANESASPKTWEVILRVTDPQYAGEPTPEDPTEDAYSVVELVPALPTTKPYLWLATIKLPASTGTVQRGHITDRRSLALPRSSRVLKTFDVPESDQFLQASSSSYQQWPASMNFAVHIPSWATECRVKIDWQSVIAPKGWSLTQVAARFGGPSESSPWTSNPTTVVVGQPASQTNSLEERRVSVGVSGTVAIPSSWRGRTLSVAGLARRAQGNSALRLDAWSSASMDLQFVEAPESEARS